MMFNLKKVGAAALAAAVMVSAAPGDAAAQTQLTATMLASGGQPANPTGLPTTFQQTSVVFFDGRERTVYMDKAHVEEYEKIKDEIQKEYRTIHTWQKILGLVFLVAMLIWLMVYCCIADRAARHKYQHHQYEKRQRVAGKRAARRTAHQQAVAARPEEDVNDFISSDDEGELLPAQPQTAPTIVEHV